MAGCRLRFLRGIERCCRRGLAMQRPFGRNRHCPLQLGANWSPWSSSDRSASTSFNSLPRPLCSPSSHPVPSSSPLIQSHRTFPFPQPLLPARRICSGPSPPLRPKDIQRFLTSDTVIDPLLEEKLDYFSRFQPSSLSIHDFMKFGERAAEKTSFRFLRKELPVRLANIMKEIVLLPPKLLSMPSCQLVFQWYIQSFKDIVAYENVNIEDKLQWKKFCETLKTVHGRHSDVVMTMAQGVIEMRDSHQMDMQTVNQIQYFLDRFYLSRISIRMLINQHVLLFGDSPSVQARDIGCIDPLCDVLVVVEDAFENARYLCDQYYLASPEMVVKVKNPYETSERVRLVYVPGHLYHMLFELFKNAMRAVIEFQGTAADSYPPVEVLICKGREDVTIQISDQGGGIARDKVDLMFKYMYSTAPQPPKGGGTTAPLAGYGYGLPLSRLYAKYFNGDLSLSSVEGYGTNAYVHLKVMSSAANELLPIYNRTCERQYETNVPVADWSNPIHTTGLYSSVH